MHISNFRSPGWSLRASSCVLAPLLTIALGLSAAFLAAPCWSTQESQQSREPGAQLRLPRQQAQTSAALDGVVRSVSSDASAQLPVSGAALRLQNLASGAVTEASANGEGVFRVFPLIAGDYSLQVQAAGYSAFSLQKITLHANEVLTLEIVLLQQTSGELRSGLPRLPELGAPLPAESEASAGRYREFRHPLDSDAYSLLNP